MQLRQNPAHMLKQGIGTLSLKGPPAIFHKYSYVLGDDQQYSQ